MAENTINVKVKQRTDTESNWASKNPVLLDGEHGYVKGSGKYKIGDGTKKWSELSYYESLNTTDKAKLDGIYNSCIHIGSTNNYPYHRFAKIDTQTDSYVDRTSTFLITQDYNDGGWGIIRISLRTNNSSVVSTVEAKWLVRCGLNVDCVQIGLYDVFGKTYADAFFKTLGAWSGTVIRNLASGARGSIARTWTLIDSTEADNTTTSDKKTSTESYASTSTAATTLHSQAYTSVVVATDGGTVSYANSAGNASKVNNHTVNADVPSGAKFTDTNTWRPLGTTADTACAGNDNRLSNARPASDVSAWAKASTKPTYTWNEIESKPSTFTPASHSHNAISMYGSNTINSTANDTTTKWGLYNNSIHFYSNTNRLTDQPSQYGFLHNISSGNAEVHQVWYEQASGSVYHRGGNASGWAGSWRRFLDTGNYNSYVPTKTGGGASGTWGINITGKATTAGTADIANSVAWGNVSGKPSTYTPSSHTHTKSQITDFPTSMPANGGNSTTVNGHTVNSNVPANAKFTDTWRGVQNNLTSTATDQSLSAYQGKVLKDLVDKKTTFTYSSTQPTSPASNAVWIG